MSVSPPAIQPGPPGSQARRGPAGPSPPPPLREPGRAPAWPRPRSRRCGQLAGALADGHPGEARCPGKTGHKTPAKKQPSYCQAAGRGSGLTLGADSTARVPRGYLRLTCRDLAAKRQASGECDPARTGRPGSRPGPRCRPPGPGHCQVHGRSAPGSTGGRPGSIAGLRQVNGGWLHGLPHHPLPVTRSPSCVMTPGPAARPGSRPPASPAGHAGRRAAQRRHAQPAGLRGRVLPGADHRPAAAGPAHRLPRPRAARPAGPAR